MPHLIKSIQIGKSIADALVELREAHDFLVAQAKVAIQNAKFNDDLWGIESKRAMVALTSDKDHGLIGKTEENLVEVINIAATVERLIAALTWFKNENSSYLIQECHPSTSHDKNGNDIVLKLGDSEVRCEICDVVSSNAGINGKEKKDLNSLGCIQAVPTDGIKRYICTSEKFAEALTSKDRNWASKHYMYMRMPILVDDLSRTQLLLIQQNVMHQ